MELGRYHFYAVRRGRIPGIYMTWADCKRQVNGFKDCEFKGFADADEAESWLRSGGVLLAPPPPPPPEPLSPPSPSPPRLGLLGSSVIVRWVKEIHWGLISLSPKTWKCILFEFVPSYVLITRSLLGMSPTLKMVSIYMVFGLCFSLRNMVSTGVNGCFSKDEAEARQDAAFQMLENILTMTGREICDYNFRKSFAAAR
ncbi:hypothetical protein Ahy_A05g025166 [Arachis hypogaea]|uniref:ribonuclease H n=1 Tax=Arachis hypogaea TaxID=3818 RepID=A0A445D8C1_ARAHY|nr:hypothetical protein Ahy_A05g025166 [Arachis hypogaea]